jgi:hypothetical protein
MELRDPRYGLPFAMTGLFFLASFLSLGVMFWPYMIPYSITVASAAAPEASLRFLFYGGIVVLPVIAVYTIGVTGSSAARRTGATADFACKRFQDYWRLGTLFYVRSSPVMTA